MREKERINCIIPMPRRENVVLKFVLNVETQLFEKDTCA